MCGSLEHPFAKGNIPLPGGAVAELAKAREELRAAMARRQKILSETSSLESSIKHLGEDMKKLEAQFLRDAGQLKEIIRLNSLNLPEPFSDGFDEKLAEEREGNLGLGKKAGALIREAELLLKKAEDARGRLEKSNERAAALEKSHLEALHREELI